MNLIVTYGPPVLAWVLAALGTLLSTYGVARLRAGYLRDLVARAWFEIQGAVLEVSQTFVDAIKAASKDGTLTEEEKAVAKANIGRKGLARLARVLGVDIESWLASKTEQAVKLQAAATRAFVVPAPLPKTTAVKLPPLPT